MALKETLLKVKEASRYLAVLDDEKISQILLRLADILEEANDKILEANKKDLEQIERQDPIYDRVLLTKERIFAIAESVRDIARYNSLIGKILEERTLENGLQLKKVSTPIGVIGVIFEARPNVVIDIFALCFKSKNACVLKGGSQSAHSNEVLVQLIKQVLNESDVSDFELEQSIELLPNDRALVAEFLKADAYIDVIVPRGGEGLIKFVRENSLVPVIETGAGVVHTYFDKDGDLEKGKNIIFNAKTNRPSVCNALDTLIIHNERLDDLIILCKELAGAKVEIFADQSAIKVLRGKYPDELLSEASDEHFGTEYLSLKMSIKTVDSFVEAISHINQYGSGHSEAIITENKVIANQFLNAVDAAAVYVNASTRFTDGGVFGLGAEVGISTQKLHARGPMGIKELTTYKWQIIGNGQVR